MPDGHAEIFTTTTIDVSGGGAQIRRLAGLPIRPTYALALAGPLLGEVFAEAIPARVQEHALSIQFTVIEPEERQALIALVLRAISGDRGSSVDQVPVYRG